MVTLTREQDGALDAPVDGDAVAPETRTTTDEPSRPWRYWSLLAGAVGIGLLVRFFFAHTDDALTNDATAYLEAGRNLVDGNGFLRNGSPELHFPPVTPFVLGSLWNLLGDPHTALELATVVFGILVILPVAAIARRLAGDAAGIAAATVAALGPGLAGEPAMAGGGSENIYLFFVLVGAWAFQRSTVVDPYRAPIWTAASGLAVGLAYLTRPEAMFIAAGIGLLVLVVGFRRAAASGVRRLLDGRLLLTALTFGVGLLVVALPYVDYLHTNTGEWSPTAKSQDASIEAWRGVADGDRHLRDQVLYELDETGFQFAAGRESLTTLIRDDPSGFAEILRINTGNLVGVFTEHPTTDHIPRARLLPLPFAGLALWGAWRHRRRPIVVALLGIGAAAMVTGLTFFVLPRYLLPTAAALSVLAGAGFAAIRHLRWRVVWVGLAALLLVGPYLTDIDHPGGYWDRREQVEHEIAGEWIAEVSVPGERIMTRAMVVAFFGIRETVAMPYSTIDELITFARHHGVTYIVMDEFNLRSLRPQFRPLFDDDPSAWEGLEIAHEFTYRGRLTRIFTLDPPVNDRSDDPVPGLGFVGDG